MKFISGVNHSVEDFALQKSETFQRLRKLWPDFAPVPRAELVLKVFEEGHAVPTIARNLGKDESTIRRDISIAELPDSHKDRIWNGENATKGLSDYRRKHAADNRKNYPPVNSEHSPSPSTDSAPTFEHTPKDRPDFMEDLLRRVHEEMLKYAKLHTLTAESMRDPKYQK